MATTARQEEYSRFAREAALAVGFPEDYESDQLIYFGELLEGKTRFLDIGANHGVYAYMANKIMKNASIALVEAHPELAAQLREKVKGWSTENGNKLEVFGVAAGDTSEMLPFFIGGMDVHGTLTQKHGGKETTRIDIPCEPLDKIFPSQEQTQIKVDVEGFEYRVLNGAKSILSKENVRVLVEVHGWGDAERGKYPYQVLGLMRRRGFSMKRLGKTHTYDFAKAGWGRRTMSWLRYAPAQGAKYLIRRSGLRPLVYKIFRPGSPA